MSNRVTIATLRDLVKQLAEALGVPYGHYREERNAEGRRSFWVPAPYGLELSALNNGSGKPYAVEQICATEEQPHHTGCRQVSGWGVRRSAREMDCGLRGAICIATMPRGRLQVPAGVAVGPEAV